MLFVPVRVDRSPIDGLGVFAIEPIAKGTLVWRFTAGFDLELDPKLIDQQPDHFRRVLLHYGYIDPRSNRFILCCDDSRFINHSDQPNLRTDCHVDRFGVDVAACDIRPGEELALDYEVVEGSRPTPAGELRSADSRKRTSLGCDSLFTLVVGCRSWRRLRLSLRTLAH